MIWLWLLACGHLGAHESASPQGEDAARAFASPGKPGAPVRYEGPAEVGLGELHFSLVPTVGVDALRVEVRAGAEVLHQSMGGPLDAGEPYAVTVTLTRASAPYLAVDAQTTVGRTVQTRAFAVPVAGMKPVRGEATMRDGRGRNIVTVP